MSIRNKIITSLGESIKIYEQELSETAQSLYIVSVKYQMQINEAISNIGSISSLCAQVPAKAKCGALLSACATAISCLGEGNFGVYGENVKNALDSLIFAAMMADDETAKAVLNIVDDLTYVDTMLNELNTVLNFKSKTDDLNAVERYYNFVIYHDAEWIPDVMKLDGDTEEEIYLAKKLAGLGKTEETKWNQEKIDQLWAGCEEIYFTYGIQIDPRFLLAIIIQEGTGSFNTSSENKAADGQNGIETNYALDLMKANHLIFGKTLGYIYYGEDFRKAVEDNSVGLVSDKKSIFNYANWKTPIIRLNKNTVEVGVYAGHSLWGEEVEKIYNSIIDEGTGEEYNEYLMSVDKIIVNEITEGMEMPEYEFCADICGQDSKGKKDYTYIIVAQRKDN